MLKRKKPFLFSVTMFLLLTSFSSSVFAADTPVGSTWRYDSFHITEGSPNYTYKQYFQDGIKQWDSLTNLTLKADGTNGKFSTGTIYKSASWDGMCYTDRNSRRKIVGARAYLNTYFTDNYSYNRALGVATHEVGHGLGLKHNSTVTQQYSVMVPDTTVDRVDRTSSPQIVDTRPLNSAYKALYSLPQEELGDETPVETIVDYSWAYTYNEMSELVDSADLIVKAKMEKIKTNKMEENETISFLTENIFKVKKVLKGNEELKNEQIIINQEIGEVDGYRIYSDEVSEFKLNEDVYLFLKQSDDGTYYTINGDQGVFFKDNQDNKSFKNVLFGNFDEEDIEKKVK